MFKMILNKYFIYLPNLMYNLSSLLKYFEFVILIPIYRKKNPV